MIVDNSFIHIDNSKTTSNLGYLVDNLWSYDFTYLLNITKYGIL